MLVCLPMNGIFVLAAYGQIMYLQNVGMRSLWLARYRDRAFYK